MFCTCGRLVERGQERAVAVEIVDAVDRVVASRAGRSRGSSGGSGAPPGAALAVDEIEFELQRRDRRELHLGEALEHALQRRARLGRMHRLPFVVAQRHEHLRARRRPRPTRARSSRGSATPCRRDRRRRCRGRTGSPSRRSRPSGRWIAGSACRIRTDAPSRPTGRRLPRNVPQMSDSTASTDLDAGMLLAQTHRDACARASTKAGRAKSGRGNAACS